MGKRDELIDGIINGADRQIVFPLAHQLYGDESVIRQLHLMYNNEAANYEIKKLILETIVQIDFRAGAAALEDIYSSAAPRLQKHIIRLLGHCSQNSSIGLLENILNNDISYDNQISAIAALTNIHSPNSLEALRKAKEREKDKTKYNLIESGIKALEINVLT